MQRRLIFGLLAVVTIWACDSATPSQPGTQAELSVVPVSVSAAPAISTLTITVSASDIASDLVFNVTMTNGEATDTITIPAGSDRTITVRGYDASNIETHRGSKTVNLTEGVNPQLTVVLEGLTGDQPLVVALGETTLTVSPETATVSVGGTTQLAAVVTDEAGDTLAVSVRWASSHPAVAMVDDSGLVSGVSLGSASVIGTYGGVGASVAVTVSDAAFAFYRDSISFFGASTSSLLVAFPTAIGSAGSYSEGGVTITADRLSTDNNTAVGVDDKTPLLSGNESSVSGREDFNLDFSPSRTELGFWFQDGFAVGEVSSPACPAADSQFDFLFLLGSDTVALISDEDPPIDVASFYGITSSGGFDRLEIRELVPNDTTFNGQCEADWIGRIYGR